MWVVNKRQPTFRSSTDEISQNTAGIYKIRSPKKYIYKGKIANSKYSRRNTYQEN